MKNDYLNKAHQYLLEQKFLSVVDLLMPIVRKDPTNLEAFSMLADAFEGLGNIKKAQELREEIRKTQEFRNLSEYHSSVNVSIFSVPPKGSTEKALLIRPVLRIGATRSAISIISTLHIRDIGTGVDGLYNILKHIFAQKLQTDLKFDKKILYKSVAMLVNFSIFNRLTGSHCIRPLQNLAQISTEFSHAEGPTRSAHIIEYSKRILNGETPPPPVFVSGAWLNLFGADIPDTDLYMIDGARRISASAIAGIGEINCWIILPETQYAAILPKQQISDLHEKIAKIPWFNNYQSIPLLGIYGQRSLQRYELIDCSIFYNQSVMDFGCNIGQASLQAIISGASTVIGVEGIAETYACAEEIKKMSGFDNLHFIQVNFNDQDFDQQINSFYPDQVDYSFFFSVYRTKELIQRDRLFEYIINKTTKGIFFEGHAHPQIDNVEYYKWLFESFELQWEFLGFSEGNLRPLFFLTKNPQRKSRLFFNRPLEQSKKIRPKLIQYSTLPSIIQSINRPCISVIISAYDSAHLLEARLWNLVQQTIFSETEIIVIDACSPQDERSIVEKFQKQYANIKYIRTEQRISIYEAWNLGIQISQAPYITNANTDDCLRLDALEILCDTLNRHPHIDLVYGDFWITHIPNQKFEQAIHIGYSLKPEFSPDIMLSGCHIGPQPVWRRSLHEKYGLFSTQFFAAGDYEFWCRCVSGGSQFLHISQFLGLYLHNLRGICNSNISQVIQETSIIQSMYKETLPPPLAEHYPTGYYWKKQISDYNTYVNIGIICYNRLEFTKQCLDSVWRHTKFPYTITVVDNASTDGTREYLQELKKQGVIKNLILLDENIGVAKASNIAWHMEPNAYYYMKLDNDIVIKKSSWLEDMITVIDRVPQIGVLGYNLEATSYPLKEFNGIRYRIKSEGNLGGAAVLIPLRTKEFLGFWAEDYGLYGEEDADYGLRIKIAGLENAYMEDEDALFHLPSGKAAVIHQQTFEAKDGIEEIKDKEYRHWKDEQRRKNMRSDGPFAHHVSGYLQGWMPICKPGSLGFFATHVQDIFLLNDSDVPKNLTKQRRETLKTSWNLIIPILHQCKASHLWTQTLAISLEHCNIPPEKILIVTNTNKYAEEFKRLSLNKIIHIIVDSPESNRAVLIHKTIPHLLGTWSVILEPGLSPSTNWLTDLLCYADICSADIVGGCLLKDAAVIDHAGFIGTPDRKRLLPAMRGAGIGNPDLLKLDLLPSPWFILIRTKQLQQYIHRFLDAPPGMEILFLALMLRQSGFKTATYRTAARILDMQAFSEVISQFIDSFSGNLSAEIPIIHSLSKNAQKWLQECNSPLHPFYPVAQIFLDFIHSALSDKTQSSAQTDGM